jgi:chromate reductase
MNETLASIPARHVLRPQIVIGGVYEKVRDGRDDLLDDIRAARFLRAVSFRILFVPSRTSAESL